MADWKADLARGRWDVEFWAWRFFGIRIHPGQVRTWRAILARDPSKWRAAYLTIMLSAGNRAGKTLLLALVGIHACMYKLGTRPPDGSQKDVERWFKAEFFWYHFGIRQEISELVYWEIVRIFSGTHLAQQDRGCPLANEVPQVAVWDKKYNGEYRWIVFHDLFGGAEVHFRTTMEKGIGTLGRDMHLVTYDECGFDERLDFVFGEVLHTRRGVTGGQILLFSTPSEGITAFADMWETGNPEAPDRRRSRMSLRMSTRDNIGFGITQEDFDRWVEEMPEELVPQNVDGYFISGRDSYFSSTKVDAAFIDDLPEMQPAADRHRYAQGVDAAVTYDSSWSIVLDITNPQRVVGVKVERQKAGHQTTDSVIALTTNNHHAYNVATSEMKSACSTAIDATGFGGKMFKDLLRHITPLRPIEFGGSRQKKLKLLGDLKTALDHGNLVMPRKGLWLVVRRQLAGYKLADRGIEQDAVMALACAWAEARRSPGEITGPVTFNPFAPEADLTPAFRPYDGWRRVG